MGSLAGERHLPRAAVLVLQRAVIPAQGARHSKTQPQISRATPESYSPFSRLAALPPPCSAVLKTRRLLILASVCTAVAALHLTSQRSRSGNLSETQRPEEWVAGVPEVLPPAGPTASSWSCDPESIPSPMSARWRGAGGQLRTTWVGKCARLTWSRD